MNNYRADIYADHDKTKVLKSWEVKVISTQMKITLNKTAERQCAELGGAAWSVTPINEQAKARPAAEALGFH